MNNLKLTLPLILILAASFTSCKKTIFNSIKGKGGIVTETRDLSGFNHISLDMDADVIYTQDSVYFVEISAQQNILKVITTEIHDGELEIDSKKWIRKHDGIQIIIHSPDLREVTLSGSGKFESLADISTAELELEVSGSGGITLASVHSTRLDAEISGSGNIRISGGAVISSEADISGSGDVETEHLTTNYSDAKISGSGSITVWALDQLKATISGSGNIKYKGNPSVSTSISGSGSVIHI